MSSNPTDRGNIRFQGDEAFAVNVEMLAQGVVVLLTGSCNMHVAGKLVDCLKTIKVEDHRVIVLDLTALDFIESTGLGGIISGFLRARRGQRELRLAAPTPAIRTVLELTRLTQLIGTYPTVEAALTS